MAKKIVSISLFNNTLHYLEAEKQPAGFFPHTPSGIITEDSLTAACRKADEIYINSLFPTALYEWELFPKVAKRYLKNLVAKDAREKSGGPGLNQVQHKPVKEVVDAGVAKWQVAYIAIEDAIAAEVWNRFKQFTKKIKFITPLPVALAATIARNDQPAEQFVAVWVSEKMSVILIATADGLVKVARTVPVGLPKSQGTSDPEMMSRLSQVLSKEISMTMTFFKQNFRESVPGRLYLLGNPDLQQIFTEHPLAGLTFDTHYSLGKSPVQGMPENQINENIHLIANFFLPEEFNFLPREEVTARKTGSTVKLAYAALILIIAGVAFWGFQLTWQRAERQREFDNKFSQLQDLQQKVTILRENVSRLEPFEGWKQLYEDTFQNRPRWNMLLSELGLLTPSNVIIEKYQMMPDKGPKGSIWNAQMAGKIKAKNWQEGLTLLRQYGGTLQASPFFDVANIQYAPEEMQREAKTFDFQIALTLTPEGSSHEI